MSLTIASLLVLILGFFGVSEIVTEAEVAEVIDLIVQFVGIIGVWYGRFRHGDINAVGLKK
jgi:hypothetical protein